MRRHSDDLGFCLPMGTPQPQPYCIITDSDMLCTRKQPPFWISCCEFLLKPSTRSLGRGAARPSAMATSRQPAGYDGSTAPPSNPHACFPPAAHRNRRTSRRSRGDNAAAQSPVANEVRAEFRWTFTFLRKCASQGEGKLFGTPTFHFIFSQRKISNKGFNHRMSQVFRRTNVVKMLTG